MKSYDWHFQIMGLFDQHNVDLLNRSCSCRRWDLTGIPCRHTISAIWCRNEDPQDYVHDVYKVSTYLRCYERAIQGINATKLWLKCDLPPPFTIEGTMLGHVTRAVGKLKICLLGHLNPPTLKRATILNPYPWSHSIHSLLLRSMQQHFQEGKNYL
ncbi:UNVERIFIED_CONTAM: hypothetical protein Sradi_4072100 [Sesamum radiatum]|uniref:SWIM-type domain-containing protein n=1 Tax=Sesamum radiatum TaxID=300843 RepID=A0AAW2PJ09_SESRA